MSRMDASPPRIEGFTFEKHLGRGGFAQVYLYRDHDLERSVAVKVLQPRHQAPVDMDAFLREARVMAMLSAHPAIVTIYRPGVTEDGLPFLMMEYCPQPHLGLRIARRPLEVGRALDVLIKVAGAVETAHQHGILHRDIKPSNILFTDYHPALTDFGISATQESAAQGRLSGMSPEWASPEQMSSRPTAVTSDVWSLGATLWTALAGRSPFRLPGAPNDPASVADRVRRVPLPALAREDVPDVVESVVRTALAKEPEHRFSSALQMIRALQGVQAELNLPVTPDGIRTLVSVDDYDGEDGDTGSTRFTGFVSVDPGAAPVAPAPSADGQDIGQRAFSVPASDTGSRPVVDETIHDAPGLSPFMPLAPGSMPAAQPASGGRPSSGWPSEAGHDDGLERNPHDPGRARFWSIAGVVATAVAIGAVVTAVLLSGEGEGTQSPDGEIGTSPQNVSDPLGEEVPSPTGVRVQRSAGELRVMWENPDPVDGDRFGVRAVGRGASGEWVYTDQTRLTVEVADRTRCVVVSLIRADGRPSREPTKGCVG